MQASFSRARTVSVQAKESRIGMKPIPLPKGVTIKLNGQSLSVKVWPMRLLAAAADGRGSSLRRQPDDSIVLMGDVEVDRHTPGGLADAIQLADKCVWWWCCCCAGSQGRARMDVCARGDPQGGAFIGP
jgi:hypothetical protein